MDISRRRFFAIRITTAFVILAAAACSPGNEISVKSANNHWDFLNENLDSESRNQCNLISKASVLEVSERLSFDQRSMTGIVVDPIKIKCLRSITNSDEIISQALAGDVVAGLLSIGERYKTKEEFCFHIDDVVRILSDIYDRKTISNGRKISRIPESYYLIGAAKFECGRPGWEEYYDQSPSRGFDPAIRHSLAVD